MTNGSVPASPADALQALVGPTDLSATAFPSGSRYHGIEFARWHRNGAADGEEVVYLKRRFVPGPERFALLQEHEVVLGDRLDKLADRYLNDSEQFWLLCDANGAIRPDALTAIIGRRLRITLPEGIPGGVGA